MCARALYSSSGAAHILFERRGTRCPLRTNHSHPGSRSEICIPPGTNNFTVRYTRCLLFPSSKESSFSLAPFSNDDQRPLLPVRRELREIRGIVSKASEASTPVFRILSRAQSRIMNNQMLGAATCQSTVRRILAGTIGFVAEIWIPSSR